MVILIKYEELMYMNKYVVLLGKYDMCVFNVACYLTKVIKSVKHIKLVRF